MTLWISVTNDRYELPCIIKDTASQLATAYGISDSNLHQSMRDGRAYKKFGVRFVKVEVRDDG